MALDATRKPANTSRYPSKRYSYEETAFDRVSSLKVYGIWPGVVRYSDGHFGLTYEPAIAFLEHRTVES